MSTLSVKHEDFQNYPRITLLSENQPRTMFFIVRTGSHFLLGFSLSSDPAAASASASASALSSASNANASEKSTSAGSTNFVLYQNYPHRQQMDDRYCH